MYVNNKCIYNTWLTKWNNNVYKLNLLGIQFDIVAENTGFKLIKGKRIGLL